MTGPDEHRSVTWTEEGEARTARWHSDGRTSPPARVVIADDTMKADAAFHLASEGTAMLWRGDYRNARQLLSAIARRVDRRRGRRGRRRAATEPGSPEETFHRYRLERVRRARILGMLLVELASDRSLRLRRAPDVREAVAAALGVGSSPTVVPLRELLGMIGAHEWRRKGVEVPALGGRIHPHYGVFAPIRQEHIELVATTTLPADDLAFDIGTGTGVLAAVLARRGVARVVATDDEPRAVACARENVARLGLADRVDVVRADLFPPEGYPGRASLVVCNPPWIPAKAGTSLERAVYDPKGRMLRRFLAGVPERLAPGGEAWLVLSDLAEHLGLRTRDQLLAAFAAAGLDVVGQADARPTHPRAGDENDPLAPYRRAETTSLWRLAAD